MPEGIGAPTPVTDPELAADAADAGLIRGVRRNLVLWSGLTTLLVLLVLGVALYVAVARTLESSGVSQLDERMGLITGQPPDLDDDNNPYGFRFGGPGSGTFSLVLGPDGLPVGPDQRLPPGLPVTSAVAAAATTGRDVRSTDVGGTPVRILTQTARGRGGDVFTIQVVQDRTAEQRTLDVMVAVLLAGGLVVILVASAFGFVYARRALVPIRESLTNQRTALRRQRDFAADASHELRTPLTVIRSSVEHLGRHRDEPVGSVGTALEDIDAEVRHMTTMVEDLLLLARSDSGAIALERLPVDLGDITADATSALAKPASDAGVAIEVDPQPVVVTGDQARLRQLVMILVDNAIRHSLSGGRVTVAVRADGAGATLTVDDQGPGIRPEDLPHVFERFYRAAGAPGGGTGLGLAIAKWVVDRHGGRIQVANRSTGGATFRVQLPIDGGPERAVAEPRSRRGSAPDRRSTRPGRRR
jgi:signal transduction histidine kinase